MLVCVSSVRGAPGVSSWALLIAAAWNYRADRVVVEADGSGGIMSARYDLPPRPGSVELVSALRRSQVEPDFQLDRVGRLLRQADPGRDRGALWAVPAPIAGHEVLAAWSELAQPVAKAMADDDRLWVADCGRVWAGSPFELLLTMADLNVVVSDSSVPALVVLPSRVQAMPGTRAVLVVGPVKHADEDLLGFTGAEMLWNVPYYSSLAERAGQLASDAKRGRRSNEWKKALAITDAMARHLSESPRVPAVAQPDAAPSISQPLAPPPPGPAAVAAPPPPDPSQSTPPPPTPPPPAPPSIDAAPPATDAPPPDAPPPVGPPSGSAPNGSAPTDIEPAAGT